MIECCANSIESAKNGEKGGAQRIELCKKLEVGGITPSRQEILQAKKLLNIKLHVLIRPRKGDFIYTNNEMQQIIEDIKFCKKVNCDGVVIGALKKDGSIDTSKIIEMIKYAKPMHITFHRAFDNGNNLLKNLEDVISCGCDTLLTSGQEKDVDAGMQNICTLIKNAQIVTLKRNNFFEFLKVWNFHKFLLILRSLTLTNSSTFSPSNSKMSHFMKKYRKST